MNVIVQMARSSGDSTWDSTEYSFPLVDNLKISVS